MEESWRRDKRRKEEDWKMAGRRVFWREEKFFGIWMKEWEEKNAVVFSF